MKHLEITKIKKFIITVILITVSNYAFSQHIGVNAAFNISKLYNFNYNTVYIPKPLTGYSLGVWLEFPFAKYGAFATELNYTRKGYILENFTVLTGDLDAYFYMEELEYIGIPILYKIKIPYDFYTSFHTVWGFSPNFHIKTTADVYEDDADSNTRNSPKKTDKVTHNYIFTPNKMCFDLIMGVGFMYKGVGLDMRYYMGLSNTYAESNLNASKLNIFLVTLNIRLHKNTNRNFKW